MAATDKDNFKCEMIALTEEEARLIIHGVVDKITAAHGILSNQVFADNDDLKFKAIKNLDEIQPFLIKNLLKKGDSR